MVTGTQSCLAITKFLDNAGDMLGAFQVEVDAHVLIGGMRLGARVAHASCDDRQTQNVDEGVVGTRSPDHGRDLHRHAVHWFSSFDHQLDEWMVGIGAGSGLTTQVSKTEVMQMVFKREEDASLRSA